MMAAAAAAVAVAVEVVADEGLLGVVLCCIKAHCVVQGDDGVEASFLWKDLVLSKEDPLFSLVPHAGRKKASTIGTDRRRRECGRKNASTINFHGPVLMAHLAQIVTLRYTPSL